MYTEGFRHLECLEDYNKVYPNNTINDYLKELHSFCDLDKFIEIYYSYINMSKRIVWLSLEFPELFRNLNLLSLYFSSKRHNMIDDLKMLYKQIKKELDSYNEPFEVMSALEYFNTRKLFDEYLSKVDKDLITELAREHEAEIMSASTTNERFDFPKLEQIEQQLNTNKVNSFTPINPLKGNDVSPIRNSPYPKEKRIKTFKFVKRYKPKK
jgi:hypothetical protein